MSETNLTDEEQMALGTFVKLMRAAETVAVRVHRRLADVNLTPSQFGVLEALLHLGPLCQKDLGAKILKSSGNLTLVLDNLEKRGLVTRERGIKDRRFITVSLTADGDKLIRMVFPRHVRAITEEMRFLTSDEQDELGRLCRTVGRQER
jgi:MarR family 2-MHQ and catechol resistance regulon transcriptional repressor